MAQSSLADEFPFRFRNLLIETIVISFIFGFAILSSKVLDEIIFIIEGLILLVVAVLFELVYGERESAARRLVSKAAVEDEQLTAVKSEKTPLAETEDLEKVVLIDSRLSRNISKAFSISAVLLWVVAGSGTTNNDVVRQISSIAFIVVVLFLPFGAFLGLLHIMRNPRVSASRVFGIYINLGVLLVGIPLIIFLLFILGAATLLVFVPPSDDPAQVMVSALLFSILLMVVVQIYFIISTLQKEADYHGLSISGYILMKLSQEEKERQKQEKIARAKHVDRLYAKLPEMKKKIKPWAKPQAQSVTSIDMSQYEYAQSSSKFKTILRELGPALLAILAADLLFAAFFLMLASMQAQ